MNQYPAERRKAILRQMMPPQNRPVSALAKENGISEQTLYTWRRNLQSHGVPVPGNGKNALVWSSADKFGVVLETARMNEADAQIDHGDVRRLGSMGIGLSLALGLARSHGGTVQAFSDGAGRGSRFEIVLPVVASAATLHCSAKAEVDLLPCSSFMADKEQVLAGINRTPG